ncbi:DUF4198 domain-containing protein [Fretibacterium sp. OH1220_COT-178]|uniref:DUF4198 domain-containing protein n=1 Tax=Fretibacterium sp. OH1220_COT-178 TaxID=2491047 RepID=UPI000F5E6009|nr:DUF4198 domain-containing protein [Fretibacterium sp. OH1220_COT-178]RRD65298.1 DUF4198 domain-containing protein [Fretibacterium sp. OH1220_COT-178]
MRKSFSVLVAVACVAVFFGVAAEAHEFWVNADYKDGLLKADLGYGHEFPNPEPIPEDRVHLFEIPQSLVTPEGTVEMKQAGADKFHYEVKADLKKGDYLVLGNYKPTFWSKGPEGWKQADKAKYKELTKADATYSEEAAMFAKLVLNVDGADSTNVITKPVGQRLEMVPQVNPATVKPGERFPVQVLVDGKPAKTAEVKAVYAGFTGDAKDGDPVNEYKAFWGRTDLNGIINIIPVKAGFWNASVEVKVPYPDKAVADEYVWVSRLTFRIAE